MEGLVSLDEWARWAERLPARKARIELADDARTRLRGRATRPVEFDLLARGVVSSVLAAREAETAPRR